MRKHKAILVVALLFLLALITYAYEYRTALRVLYVLNRNPDSLAHVAPQERVISSQDHEQLRSFVINDTVLYLPVTEKATVRNGEILTSVKDGKKSIIVWNEVEFIKLFRALDTATPFTLNADKRNLFYDIKSFLELTPKSISLLDTPSDSNGVAYLVLLKAGVFPKRPIYWFETDTSVGFHFGTTKDDPASDCNLLYLMNKDQPERIVALSTCGVTEAELDAIIQKAIIESAA